MKISLTIPYKPIDSTFNGLDLTQLQSRLLGRIPGTPRFIRWRLGFHAVLTVFSSGAGFPEHPGGVEEDRAAVQTVLWSDDRQRQHGRHIHQSAQSNRDAVYWTAVGTGQLGLLAGTSQTLRTWTMIFFCCLLQSNIFLLKRQSVWWSQASLWWQRNAEYH